MAFGNSKLPASLATRAIFLGAAAMLAVAVCLIELSIGHLGGAAVLSVIAAPLMVLWIVAVAQIIGRTPRRQSISTVGRLGQLLLGILFWTVAAGLLFIALGWAAAAIQGMIPLIYAFPMLIVLLATFAAAIEISRRRRAMAILGYVEQGVSRDFPLPPFIQAVSQGEYGKVRQRLIALHKNLERGEPIDVALAVSVPEVPLSALRATAAGERLGRLPEVLRRLTRRTAIGTEDEGFSPPSPRFYRSYPLLVLLVASFFIIFVSPKFEAIFHDFHIKLPAVTRAMLYVDRVDYLPAVLFIVAFLPLGQAISRMFPSGHGVAQAPFEGVVADYLIWWMPGFGKRARDEALAEMCDLLAAGIEAGRPLDQVLGETADAIGNAVLRHRVSAWAGQIAEGLPVAEAARRARMPELIVGMLGTARDSRGSVEVLVFLRRHYEFRVNRTRAILQALYVPVVVVLMGAFVAWIGLSMFLPLVKLIEVNSSYGGGF